MAKEITCKHCGKVFTSRHIHVNFCSRRCYADHRAAPVASKICPVCGIEFTYPKRPHKKYCSDKCSRIGRIKPGNNRTCEHCGKLFHHNARPDYETQPRFCSRECYDNHRTESRNLCLNCGKRVKGGGAKGGYKYCSHACKVEHLKPQPRPCVNCGTIFTPIKKQNETGKYIAHNAGKTCSVKCEKEWNKNNPERKRKISVAFTGSKHPNWQGGKSATNLAVNRGSGWPRIAEKARARDKYTCQKCGKPQEDNGRKLDVHHIVAYHDINDTKKANRMSNLISLCASCHTKEEHKIQHQQIVLPFAKIAQADRRAARASAHP